ncbi:MAG: O-antigen ligase family protein [Pseudomonadota bacterium]
MAAARGEVPDSRLVGPALLAAAVLAPFLGLFAPLAIAVLFVILGAVVLFAAWRQGMCRPWGSETAVLAALCAWALATAPWAVDPSQAVAATGKLAGTAVVGLLFVRLASRQPPEVLPRIATWVLAAVVALMAVEYLSGGFLSHLISLLLGEDDPVGKSRLNRGCSVLAVLLWPLAALVHGRWGPRRAVPLVAAAVAALLVADNSSAKAAALAGAATALAAIRFPRASSWALRLGMVVLLAFAPLMARHLPDPQWSFVEWRELPTSMHHRLTIWRFTASKVAEKPIVGWGMDAARALPGGKDTVTVVREDDSPARLPVEIYEQQLPLHPHSAVLQVWLELGAVGILLAGALLWRVIGRLGARGGVPQAAYAMGAVAAGAVVANMSFGLWQSWWQSTLWITAILCAASLAPRWSAR